MLKEYRRVWYDGREKKLRTAWVYFVFLRWFGSHNAYLGERNKSLVKKSLTITALLILSIGVIGLNFNEYTGYNGGRDQVRDIFGIIAGISMIMFVEFLNFFDLFTMKSRVVEAKYRLRQSIKGGEMK